MSFGIFEFLTLIGALGFFIYGMKVMSEGIQKVAGSKMRQILGAMTSNRAKGIGTGFLITSLIQSSSATTVMTVSFVNAGLLSLRESIGVIMGANIGTTVTAWLIALFGFGKFSIGSLALPIIAVGFPMLFINRDQIKSLGEILIGFALLFMGLGELKEVFADLKNQPQLLEFFRDMQGNGMLTTITFVAIGTVVTILVQSSSAAMAMTLSALYEDIITFDIAAAMVLGENIGTTITANLAAIIGNVHAKRAARAHLIFNLFGVVWMILLFPYFLDLLMKIWEPVQAFIMDINPELSKGKEELQLSLFHTSFNIINVLLLVGFVPFIANVVKKVVKPKGDEDEMYTLEYIGAGMVNTPELALLEAKKEIAKFASMTKKSSNFVMKMLTEADKRKFLQYLERVEKYEEITDRIEVEVADYLAKASEGELSESSSIRIRGMISVTSELERIGDICYQMAKNLERKAKKKIWFTPKQRQNLLDMFGLINLAFDEMIKNINEDQLADIEHAQELETEVNHMRDALRKKHLKHIEKGEYPMESGMIYADLVDSLETMGDRIISVNEGLIGQV